MRKVSMSNEEVPAIGIIGGSGLYGWGGLEEVREVVVETPFGSPSDALVEGRFGGRRICFLPRHGKGHQIAPLEINHRANLCALRMRGVRFVICVTAVGSLQEAYAPRHVVLPSQFYDRTSRRAEHTFFGQGVVAHVSMADPISTGLRRLLADASRAEGLVTHEGGTYVHMDGPAFSTRAESQVYQKLGFDVIGMTNLPEAKLAREAEMALATLAMITDYDCWKTDEPPVTASTVFAHLQANAEAAQRVLARVIPQIPLAAEWPEHHALDHAFATSKEVWPEETRTKLQFLLQRFL